MTDTANHTHKITVTRYGIAEILKWCIDRNHKNISGNDTPAFQRMKSELANRPNSSDYFTLDQYWKQRVTIDFTDEEIHTIDRCLYENPNSENNQNPAIRYRFWVECNAKKAVGATKDNAP